VEHVPDAKLFAVAFAALACCMVWLGAAAWRHRRNLRAIPVRIHVAGTRGKSTTTRLIAAGLRAGGLRVVAKTTGTEPRLILPDGSEAAWPRRGPPSVREQTRFFAKAVRLRADAAVVECMAIRPEMVFASEHHLIRATTAVITNARADHLEDIGEHPDAAADAMRWAVPVNGKLFVADEAATPALRSSAHMRGTDIIVVDTAGLGALAADRALALAVCAAQGVPAAIAGEAMDNAASDPGGFFTRDLAVGGKAVRFANAFACNDVTSLALLGVRRRAAASQWCCSMRGATGRYGHGDSLSSLPHGSPRQSCSWPEIRSHSCSPVMPDSNVRRCAGCAAAPPQRRWRSSPPRHRQAP
jgi:poly-gamma-glutamate synthase PgsB/CapB